jgi:hypothetical protein
MLWAVGAALVVWAWKSGYLGSGDNYSQEGFNEAQRRVTDGSTPSATVQTITGATVPNAGHYANLARQAVEAFEGTWVGREEISAIMGVLLRLSDADLIEVSRSYVANFPPPDHYPSLRSMISAEYILWGTEAASQRTSLVNRLASLGL